MTPLNDEAAKAPLAGRELNVVAEQSPTAVSPAGSDGQAPEPSSPQVQRRAVASGAIGSALEWFDFSVYGALSATLFPSLFFSSLGATGGVLASLASFGVGFVARPLGGIVFGYLGDRIGRRPVLMVTLVLMGLSSFAIGLLPAKVGIGAAVVLVALRFLQGFSLGGEATGGQLLAMEHAAAHRRGLLGALVNVGSPLSQVLSNLVLVLLTAVLTPEQWASWGWRIPFLVALVLVGTGVYIRLRIEETPAFVARQEGATAPPNGLEVLRRSPLRIIQLAFSWAGPAAAFYLVTVYGLSYLTKQAGVSADSAFLVLLIGNTLSVATGVLGGWVSDRVGRKPVFVITAMICLVCALTFFPAANTGNLLLIAPVVLLAACAVQFGYGAQPAFFAEQFPTSMRYSGSALSFTLSNLLFGAWAPLAAAALASSFGTWAVVALSVAVLVGSLVAIASLKDRARVDLADWAES